MYTLTFATFFIIRTHVYTMKMVPCSAYCVLVKFHKEKIVTEMANVNGAPLSRRTSFFFFFLLPLPSTEENVFQREFSSRIRIEFNGRSYDYIFILRNGMFMQIEIPLNVTYTLFLFFYSVARRLRIIVMVIFSPFFLSHRTNFTRNREGRRGTSVEYIESNQSPRTRKEKK